MPATTLTLRKSKLFPKYFFKKPSNFLAIFNSLIVSCALSGTLYPHTSAVHLVCSLSVLKHQGRELLSVIGMLPVKALLLTHSWTYCTCCFPIITRCIIHQLNAVTMLSLAPGSFWLINTELQMTQTDVFGQQLTDDCTNDKDRRCTLS